MAEITLTRTSKWPRRATFGTLMWPAGECYTLEDALIFKPYAPIPIMTVYSSGGSVTVSEVGLDGFVTSKIPGMTAIPQGRYRVIQRQSTRFKRKLPCLLDVPGFSDILIHAGNTEHDTQGCVLLGTDVSGWSLTYSVKALERFMTWFAPAVREDRIYLTVENPK